VKPPLRVVLPGDTETPVSAFLKLAATAPQAFLLESVEPGDRVGRFSFIGINPRRVLRTQVGEGPGPFALLEDFVRHAHAPRLEGYPPFTGGLVGFIGYDAVKRLEPKVPIANPDETGGFPEAVFFDVDTVVAFDNVKRAAAHLAGAAGGRSARAGRGVGPEAPGRAGAGAEEAAGRAQSASGGPSEVPAAGDAAAVSPRGGRGP